MNIQKVKYTAKKTVKTENANTSKNNDFISTLISNIEAIDQEHWEFYLTYQCDMLPKNLFTLKPYQRINYISLILDLIKNKYTSAYYATFKQISDAGGKIKKGATSSIITYYNFIVTHKETKEKITIGEYNALSEEKQLAYQLYPIARMYRLFNADWIENFDTINLNHTPDMFTNEDFETEINIQKLLNDLSEFKCLNLEHNLSGSAYYSLVEDRVNMPLKTQFKSENMYYATLFHEIIHWTGHKSRLDRFDVFDDNKEKYALEELVAEIGAMLLCQEFNILSEVKNSVIYLKSWLTYTTSDNITRCLENAFSLSQKAINYLK